MRQLSILLLSRLFEGKHNFRNFTSKEKEKEQEGVNFNRIVDSVDCSMVIVEE